MEKEDRHHLSDLKYYFLGAFVGIASIVGLQQCVMRDRLEGFKAFRATDKVQQGYVAPNRLEIYCTDLDRNGEQETIMQVDNASYLLKEIDGKPVLLPYKIIVNEE